MKDLEKHANILGMAGLIPFLAMPYFLLTGYLSQFEAVAYQSQYSAVILSFLGGVHWYDAHKRTHCVSQLYLSMLPSIVAWVSLVLFDPNVSLLILASSFLLLLMYDFKRLAMTDSYKRLRILLTSVVIGCHGAMIFLIS